MAVAMSVRISGESSRRWQGCEGALAIVEKGNRRTLDDPRRLHQNLAPTRYYLDIKRHIEYRLCFIHWNLSSQEKDVVEKGKKQVSFGSTNIRTNEMLAGVEVSL